MAESHYLAERHSFREVSGSAAGSKGYEQLVAVSELLVVDIVAVAADTAIEISN